MGNDLQVFARGTLAAVMRSLMQCATRYDSNQYRSGYMDALRDVAVAFELADPIVEKCVDCHSSETDTSLLRQFTSKWETDA